MTATTQGPHTFRMPSETLALLYQAIAAEAGSRVAAEAMRKAGSQCGGAILESLQRNLEAWEGVPDAGSTEADRFWELLGYFFAELGWGHLAAETLHDGIVLLQSADWAEAREDTATFPSCHFTTGLLSDLLGRVGAVDLAVLEVECRSAGDENCRFLVGSEQALVTIHEALRAGGGFRDALRKLG